MKILTIFLRVFCFSGWHTSMRNNETEYLEKVSFLVFSHMNRADQTEVFNVLPASFYNCQKLSQASSSLTA